MTSIQIKFAVTDLRVDKINFFLHSPAQNRHLKSLLMNFFRRKQKPSWFNLNLKHSILLFSAVCFLVHIDIIIFYQSFRVLRKTLIIYGNFKFKLACAYNFINQLGNIAVFDAIRKKKCLLVISYLGISMFRNCDYNLNW